VTKFLVDPNCAEKYGKLTEFAKKVCAELWVHDICLHFEWAQRPVPTLNSLRIFVVHSSKDDSQLCAFKMTIEIAQFSCNDYKVGGVWQENCLGICCNNFFFK